LSELGRIPRRKSDRRDSGRGYVFMSVLGSGKHLSSAGMLNNWTSCNRLQHPRRRVFEVQAQIRLFAPGEEVLRGSLSWARNKCG